MKNCIVLALMLAACTTPPSNTVYSCVLYAECNGYTETETQNVCEGDQADAQAAVDTWVSDCAATLSRECQSYDCYADCEPTGADCMEETPSVHGPIPGFDLPNK